MTREQRLSIVVAFGLMLFVGILVSDHFSAATSREAADLSSLTVPPLPPTVDIVDTEPPPLPVQDPRDDVSRIHRVRAGETLRSICADAYGDSVWASPVAVVNDLGSIDHVEVGQELLLPSREELLVVTLDETADAPETTPQQPTAAPRSYVVVPGDTLSQIAQRLLGSARRTDQLWNLNREQLPSRDDLKVGMTLQLPPAGS